MEERGPSGASTLGWRIEPDVVDSSRRRRYAVVWGERRVAWRLRDEAAAERWLARLSPSQAAASST